MPPLTKYQPTLRSVIYLTTCPIQGKEGTKFTTSSITTTLAVPCFADKVAACPATLAAIYPGCGSLPAPALGGGGGGSSDGSVVPQRTKVTLPVDASATTNTILTRSGIAETEANAGGTPRASTKTDAGGGDSSATSLTTTASFTMGKPTGLVVTAGAVSMRAYSMATAVMCITLVVFFFGRSFLTEILNISSFRIIGRCEISR